MILYDRERAIQRMNTLAKEGKDFIFIINYKADGAYVEEYADIIHMNCFLLSQAFLISLRAKATTMRLWNGIPNHSQEMTMNSVSILSSKESVKATVI